MHRTLIAAAALAAMLAPALAAPLDAEGLAAAITGRAYTGVDPANGATVASVVYAEDGTSVLTFPDGRQEAGSWRLAGDAYCTRYAAFRDNTENCFRLEPRDDGMLQAYSTDGTRALLLVPAD